MDADTDTDTGWILDSAPLAFCFTISVQQVRWVSESLEVDLQRSERGWHEHEDL